MAKSQDAKKNVKKEPLLTAKEKRQQNAIRKLKNNSSTVHFKEQ